ncbi:MAG: sensor histidine kinase [Candidatus Limnocylindria bacterium]
MSRRFVRRFVAFAVLFLVVISIVVVAIALLVGALLGQDGAPPNSFDFGSFVEGMLRGNIASSLGLGISWLVTTILRPETVSSIPLAILILVALVVVIRLGRGLRGATVPLGDLIDASARVEAGEVGTQVDVRGPREIRALARAFNAMSSRLAADTDQRRRFLADVSHELRTPLTVIQGSVEGMLDGLYPADRPQLERLLAETHQLERLIDDLRTLSLTDAGALELHRDPVELGPLAADVVAGFQPQASSEGVTLSVELEDAPMLSLDARRVRQVIGNLLSNALRHTESGGRITVGVRPVGNAVQLEVADTGAGMDPESATHAFERFWRSGDTAGAGLGLAIVRDLVGAHGGEASLESTPGAGTTVRCRFPVEVEAALQPA